MTASVATGSGFGASGANAAPTVTVPAGLATGTYLLIALSENAADAITATPAGLTLLDSTNISGGTFPNKMYSATVGSGAGQVPAGTVLAWTLSATKQWAAIGVGLLGVDAATPAPVVINSPALVANTAIAPTTSTTTENLLLLEIVSVKANGANVTSIPAATGWTQRSFIGSGNTFGGAFGIYERTAGIAPAGGTYGGDTYTPNQATAAYTTWVIGVRSAAVALTTYVPASDTGATTSSWSKTPSGAASFAAVVADTDPATYAESPPAPTNSVLRFAIPDVSIPTDLTTAGFSFDIEYAGTATSGTAILSLLQGGSIVKTGSAQALTAGFVTYTVNLSSTEAAALTKTGNLWQNLAIQATVTAS